MLLLVLGKDNISYNHGYVTDVAQLTANPSPRIYLHPYNEFTTMIGILNGICSVHIYHH